MSNQQQKFITLGNDIIFKSIFDDHEHVEFITALLTSILNVSYEDLDGKVILKSKEIPIDKTNDKRFRVDILALVNDKYINIEMNYHDKNELRNFGYLCTLQGRQFTKGKDYKDIKTCIQVNFNNKGYEDKTITTYSIKDEFGNTYPYSFKIINVSLEKCKNLDYNKSNELEKWGLLMNVDTLERFKEILETVDIPDSVKEHLLEKVTELAYDDSIIDVVSKEEYLEWVFAEEKKEQEKLLKEHENKLQEEKIKTAKELKAANVDIEIISKATELPKEIIQKL